MLCAIENIMVGTNTSADTCIIMIMGVCSMLMVVDRLVKFPFLWFFKRLPKVVCNVDLQM